jgi:predicted DNA-binding protein
MPSSNSRLNIVLDRELQRDLRLAAEKRGKSLAAAAAELIRDALERDEDLFLARLSERREKSSKRRYSDKQAWKGKLGLRPSRSGISKAS